MKTSKRILSLLLSVIMVLGVCAAVPVNSSAVEVTLYGDANCDDVVNMAVRAAKQGLRVMIDFHYSDFFADPHSQTTPAAWQNYSYAQLLD
ncbi:MAG: glycosyl hydrolase 53 family protein, partial [Clostridia bacterium]|nr:glycosyl hydrolase 53 family protein [Clostridia bacterium]